MNMSNIVSKSLVAAVVVPSEIAALKMDAVQVGLGGVGLVLEGLQIMENAQPQDPDLGANQSQDDISTQAVSVNRSQHSSASADGAKLELILKKLGKLEKQTNKAADSAVEKYRKETKREREEKEKKEKTEEEKEKKMFFSNCWMAAFVVLAVAIEFFAVDILKVVLFGDVVEDGFEGYVDQRHLGDERYFAGWTCGEIHHCSPRNYTLNCCAAFLSLVIMGVFLGLFCGLWTKCLAGQELCFGLTVCYPEDLSNVCACCNNWKQDECWEFSKAASFAGAVQPLW